MNTKNNNKKEKKSTSIINRPVTRETTQEGDVNGINLAALCEKQSQQIPFHYGGCKLQNTSDNNNNNNKITIYIKMLQQVMGLATKVNMKSTFKGSKTLMFGVGTFPYAQSWLPA